MRTLCTCWAWWHISKADMLRPSGFRDRPGRNRAGNPPSDGPAGRRFSHEPVGRTVLRRLRRERILSSQTGLIVRPGRQPREWLHRIDGESKTIPRSEGSASTRVRVRRFTSPSCVVLRGGTRTRRRTEAHRVDPRDGTVGDGGGPGGRRRDRCRVAYRSVSPTGHEPTAASRASVRRHRSVLGNCLWPQVRQFSLIAAAPGSDLSICHPRSVNAYRRRFW
jgi:hypothetical protein